MPDDLKSLMEENLKVSKKILENTQSIRKHIFWSRVWSGVKLLLIIIPLVLAAVYLPPLVSKYWTMYGNLFGKGGQQSDVINQFKNLSPDSLGNLLKLAPPDVQKQLQK
jgi:hypothetical protein